MIPPEDTWSNYIPINPETFDTYIQSFVDHIGRLSNRPERHVQYIHHQKTHALDWLKGRRQELEEGYMDDSILLFEQATAFGKLICCYAPLGSTFYTELLTKFCIKYFINKPTTQPTIRIHWRGAWWHCGVCWCHEISDSLEVLFATLR